MLRLHAAQESMATFDALYKASSTRHTYNRSVAIEVSGSVDQAAFIEALKKTIERHEALRSTLRKVDDINYLHVIPFEIYSTSPWPIAQIKAKNYRPAAQLAMTLNEANEAAFLNTPFELNEGPLWRCALVQHTECLQILFLCHHLIVDETSFSIIFRDISYFYNTSLGILEQPLPVIPSLAGLNLNIKPEEQNKRLDYWKTQLANLAAVDLPLDFIPSSPETLGKRIYFNLSAELIANAKQKFAGFSINQALLASLFTSIHAYTTETDLCLGFTSANRMLSTAMESTDQLTTAILNKIANCFFNSIPLRIKLSPTDNFLDVLRKVKEHIGAGLKNQLPLETVFQKALTKASKTAQTSARPFKILFVHNTKKTSLSLHGTTATYPLELDLGTNKFELGLNADELPDGSYLCFAEFNTKRFSEKFIRRFVQRLDETLQYAVKNPLIPLNEMPLLLEDEKSIILPATIKPITNTNTLPLVTAMFQLQAKLNPIKEALVFHSAQSRAALNYQQLQTAVNKLAHYIAAKPAGNLRVGVSVTRSSNLFVAILAVLQSGRTLVTLETNEIEKIKHKIFSAELSIIITDDVTQKLFKDENITTINLDDKQTQAVLAVTAGSEPDIHITPNDAAYIMYTSGTTKGSKGVILSHEGLANLLVALKDENFHPYSNVLCTASATFDALLYDVVVAILTAGKIHFTLEENRYNPSLLNSIIKQEQIDVAVLLPEVISSLKPAPLSHLISMGAQAHPDVLHAWQKQQPQTIISNEYGTTEIGIKLTRQLFKEGNDPALIGPPITNMTCVILNPHFQLCPLGVQGELYVAGPGVALGYLSDPVLTDQKFIHCRFDQEKLAFIKCDAADSAAIRMYATGDAAAYQLTNDDQSLSIKLLGRTDRQLKIHGVRIDLDAIVQVLRTNPLIKDAEVLANKEQTVLTAFVVPAEENISREKIQETIRLQLVHMPSVAIPNKCVLVPGELPLTVNGKVDQTALRTLAIKETRTTIPLIMSDLQTKLATIWAQQLEVSTDEIDLEVTFKQLGGNSLSLLPLEAALNKIDGYEFIRNIEVTDLLLDMTIASLAEQLDSLVKSESQFIELPEGFSFSGSRIILNSTNEQSEEDVLGLEQSEENMLNLNQNKEYLSLIPN